MCIRDRAQAARAGRAGQFPGEAARQEVGGGDGAPAVGGACPLGAAQGLVQILRPAQCMDELVHVAQAQVQALAGHRVQGLRGIGDAHDAAVDQRAFGVQAQRKALQRRNARQPTGLRREAVSYTHLDVYKRQA